MRVVGCLFTEHDLWLVALAAVVCIAGGAIAFNLFRRATERSGQQRYGWAFLAAVTAGSSVWCTHFIAMLAYEVSAPVSFNPILTFVSLLCAIVASGVAFNVALKVPSDFGISLSGCILGLGIAVMHYSGMAAYHVSGDVTWSGTYVAVSIAIAVAFSGMATREFVRKRLPHSDYVALALFVFAVVGLHFTGMAAVTVTPLAGITDTVDNGDFAALAIAVAGVGLMIVATGVTSFMIDTRESRDSNAKLHAFIKNAPAAVAMFDKDMNYIAHTDRWLRDYSLPGEPLVGRSHYDVFPDIPDHWRQQHARTLTGAVETSDEEVFRRADGTELTLRWEVRPWRAGDGNIGGIMMLTEEISERKRTEQTLWNLAKLDALTAIPNRFHFNEHIERSIADARTSGGRIAVVGIDLDGFKEINDCHGHRAGDHVLKALAERMTAQLRPGEFIARLGGDEFAGVKQISDTSEISAFAERIKTSISERIFFEECGLVVGSSLGVAVFPEHGTTASVLVSNADLAMYRAKASQRDEVCFYDPSMDEAARERTTIVRDVGHAIERNEFELHYQVQSTIKTAEVCGFEVLLRWKHPERGSIPPALFIPIAEETGAIVKIGEWVLRTACREAAGWDVPNRIAVNVSAVQLASGDFASTLRDVLVESGLSPSRLELEITETAIIADKARALHLMRQIKAMGVTIAIDDFGAGYSSLGTLRAFPFDKIKIDRSFTQELERKKQSISIVRAIVALAKGLDILVLAEGVETPEQLEILREEGCDEAQGYLLGRPKPVADAIAADLRRAPVPLSRVS